MKPKTGEEGLLGPSSVVVVSHRTRNDGWVALVVKGWGKRPIKIVHHPKGKTESFGYLQEAMRAYQAKRSA